jgi:hypothetical protein
MTSRRKDWIIATIVCVLLPPVLPMTLLAVLVLSISNGFKKEGGYTDEV